MLTRKNDASFDFDVAKATEQSRDNPVWYVQYGHARTRSVLRQAAAAGVAIDGLDSAPIDRLGDAGELAGRFGGARVELVDGRALTWYGPRIPAALASFRELLEGAA